MWSLHSEEQEPENLDRQIDEILGKLASNTEVWQTLARQYRTDLFCGLFMSGGNQGLSISPRSLLSLGQRGIELGLDVYGPGIAAIRQGIQKELKSRIYSRVPTILGSGMPRSLA